MTWPNPCNKKLDREKIQRLQFEKECFKTWWDATVDVNWSQEVQEFALVVAWEAWKTRGTSPHAN